jgi:hypothetical protein
VSAVKSGAVSLIRGTLDVTGGTVAVLMVPPDMRDLVCRLNTLGQTKTSSRTGATKTKPIRIRRMGFASLLR